MKKEEKIRRATERLQGIRRFQPSEVGARDWYYEYKTRTGETEIVNRNNGERRAAIIRVRLERLIAECHEF